MKRKTLVILLCTLLTTFFWNLAHTQCQLTQTTMRVTNVTTLPNGSCEVTFTVAFNVQANGGNKYLYLHLWQASQYPNLNYTSSPTTAQLTAGGAPLVTIAIDNGYTRDTYTPAKASVFMDNYPPGPDATTAVNLQNEATLGFVKDTINSNVYRYRISNAKIVVPGGCSQQINVTGDAWSTQANSETPTVHCQNVGFNLLVADPVAASNLICGAPYSSPTSPNTLSVRFSTTAAPGVNVNFRYQIFRDANNDGQYTVADSSGTSSILAEGNTMVNSNTTVPMNFTIANSTLAQKNSNLLVVMRDIVVTNNNTTPATVTTVEGTNFELATNNCSTLPVTFGAVKAANKNGQLIVDWQALTEENVDYYAVEASKDGSKWKEIGKLNSKASNGSSTATLSYQLVIGLPISFAAVGFTLILLFPAFRSRKMQIMALLIAIGTIIACTNSAKEVDVNKEDTIFVRIAQYDKDSNKPQYSNIMKVIKE